MPYLPRIGLAKAAVEILIGNDVNASIEIFSIFKSELLGDTIHKVLPSVINFVCTASFDFQ